jgi:DNA polymerase III subunit gamma/tau
MDNYIVSARKYRPVTFRSVVGQETITNTLKNAIRNQHVAQAYLFCGPRGVGKTTCARILAKTINCFNLTAEIDPCNTCESCKSFNENASFNIHELDAASNNGVDEIRALIDQVRFAPQVGKYSIYIIDEVHMLSNNAFNAFLKTLEEPPAHAVFILATTERHKILPTILSRCQVFTFNRIGVDAIADHLKWVAGKENIEAEPEALHVIAQKADGGLRDALSMFDQIVSFSGGEKLTYLQSIENLNVLDYEVYFRLIDSLWAGNYGDALMEFNDVLSKGFDGGNFLAGLGDHFRNLLVCQDAVTLSLLEVSDAVKSRYQTQARDCKPIQLIRALDMNTKTEMSIKSSRNQRLLIELLLMQLSQLNIIQEEKKKPESTLDQPTVPVSSAPTSTQVAEPQPAAKTPVLNFKGKPTLKTVSIKSLSGSVQEDGNKIEGASTSLAHSLTEDIPTQEFTESDLLQAWLDYSKGLESEGRKAMAANLTLGKPALLNSLTIQYVVQNDSQMREIDAEKTELMGYLRKRLKNFSIKLVLEKSEMPIQTRPYTADEKLKALEEKNAAITQLKQRLGLQLE